MCGLRKLWLIASCYLRRNIVFIKGSRDAVPIPGALNRLSVGSDFTFVGLHPYLEIIRERMLGIIKDPVPANHQWGKGGFIGVHVRMGDFAQVSESKVIISGKTNVRIPVSWYVSVVEQVRLENPEMAISIFSDGKEEDLGLLLRDGATLYNSGSDINRFACHVLCFRSHRLKLDVFPGGRLFLGACLRTG